MSEHSAAGGEVIPLDLTRRRPRHAPGAARPAPAGGSASGRPRCGATTVDGRACRNYAGPSGRCAVHAVATSAGDQQRRIEEAARPELPPLKEWEDAVAGVLSFLRRRLTGAYSIDLYGFDRELTEQVIAPLARPLYQRYWRVRTVGVEHIPDDGGVLLVANHSGTLPFDAVMTKLAVYDEHPQRRHLRELAADLAMRTPVIGPLSRKTGNALAHDDDAIRLLSAGEAVGVWPEGYKGLGKHYRDRYKLQRFGRGGFVEVALRTGAPIVPVAIVGAEEIYPIVANVRPLARLLGLPYFPMTWQFPLLGPAGLLPLPSKWVIEFGEPIPTTSYPSDAADDPMTVLELSDRVRDTIQQMLYRTLLGRRSVFF